MTKSFYTVSAPNGDSCSFKNGQRALEVLMAIAKEEGSATIEIKQMTLSEYAALPTTSGSVRIWNMVKAKTR